MTEEDTAFFLVCNADRGAEDFGGVMSFSQTLIPYKWDSSWIEQKLGEMVAVLNSDSIPGSHNSCQNCAYSARKSEFLSRNLDPQLGGK